jgi:predicted deacetylase
MAILRRQFFYHEKGNHDERWHWLARDTDTGRVFVINGYAPMGQEDFETESEVGEFLTNDNSSARTKLLEVIGSLVTEPDT